MKKKKIFKKACFVFLSISLICHSINKYKQVTSPPKINQKYDGTNYFATYNNGHIYICTISNQGKVCSQAEYNDIVIIDSRDNDDPDMKIIDSYSIYDVFTMQEVLNAIIAYEERNPSKWDRTKSSMLKEWICHNLSYMCNFETDRTKDADLNNADEQTYQDITLSKMIEYRGNYIDQ